MTEEGCFHSPSAAVVSDLLLVFRFWQRWVRAFRPEAFHVRVSTNNGIERQNRALKHDYLQAYRDRTLSGLFTVLVEKFHPDAFRK